MTATDPLSPAVHFIDLVIQDGTVEHRFRCTATEDAPCRRRPPDAEDGRESWTAEEATETGHDCWALDWIEAVGIGLALYGADQTLASAPVSITYDECVEVDLMQQHPALPGVQETTDIESLVETDGGLALANAAWSEGAGQMFRACKEHVDGEVWHKPVNPYSAPLLARVKARRAALAEGGDER